MMAAVFLSGGWEKRDGQKRSYLTREFFIPWARAREGVEEGDGCNYLLVGGREIVVCEVCAEEGGKRRRLRLCLNHLLPSPPSSPHARIFLKTWPYAHTHRVSKCVVNFSQTSQHVFRLQKHLVCSGKSVTTPLLPHCLSWKCATRR